MATFTRAAGVTVRPADMVLLSTMKVQSTKDLGLTTNSTARAKKCGKRPPKFTRVNSSTEKRMALVNFLTTEVSTMDNSSKDRCKDMVNITSPMMVRFTRAHSKTTTCTEKVSSSGQIFNIMRVILRMAWWTAKEFCGSQMVTDIKVLLRLINPMELVSYIASRNKLRDRELGKQVRELSGYVIPLSALFLSMEIKNRYKLHLKWRTLLSEEALKQKLLFHNKIQIPQLWDIELVVRPICISNLVQNKSRKWRAFTRLKMQPILLKVSNTWVRCNLESNNPLICSSKKSTAK